MKIGFIGLGNMGLPMAVNLASSGHDVTGFDIAEIEFPKMIAPAADAASCVAGCEVVITMLPNGAILRKVAEAVIPAMQKGAILCDCSTVDVRSARKVAETAEQAGLGLWMRLFPAALQGHRLARLPLWLAAVMPALPPFSPC